MIIKEYEISNLNCAGCSAKIEDKIKSLPEVSFANLDFLNKKLTIQFHESIDNALERLNQIADSIEAGVSIAPIGLAVPQGKSKFFWLPIGLGVFMIIAAHFVSLSPLAETLIGIIAYLLVAHRVLMVALKGLLRKKVFSEHFLMSIATIGAIYLGEYTEAAAVMVLYEIGQYLENRAIERSRSSIKSMLSLKPERAHKQTPDGIKDYKLSEIATGDIILVYPGERVPLDAVITKGETTVDTSSLTGEAEPLYVNEGMDIYAGYMNNSGLIKACVRSVEAESTISRILKLIESATARKSPQEKFITRFAGYYTPAVVLGAFLVFLIPVLLGASSEVWLKRSLVFLIVSCPCALVISIPLTYYISIGIAAKRGIILKGSNYLDVLNKVRTVVFDKTGTLTTGELKIDKLLILDESNPEELIDTLYRAEYTSSHPFALAIKSAYSAEYSPALVNAYSEYSGKGILLQYDSDLLIAGSEAYIREYGFVNVIDTGAASAVHAVKNNVYLGCITFTDEVKRGMKEVIQSLRGRGITHFAMLSGDRHQKAEIVSREVGLDAFYAELLPSQKLEKLEQIMRSKPGKLAYVGDGMNDAPTLARADVGIAMGKIGNQASIESADVVLLNDRPEQLAGAFTLADATNRTVIQNIVFALGVKASVMALGISGISGLWEAIIADVGVTLLVVFNSMRMMKAKRHA
ncbi:MAG: heavy metal translocating P-type ATPase [Candidatus Cloacimonadaceae bacterium]|nr:heavy metal translocating P-type ATPase [Candidatus Cloacimonadaceae bacterium]